MNSSNIKLEKFSEVMIKDSSKIITAAGVMLSVMSNMHSIARRPNYWEMRYKITGEEKYHVKYLRMTKSHIWLKMHGYPMRRNNHH